MKRFITTVGLLFMIACSGSHTEDKKVIPPPPPPIKTGYGIFRALSPKTLVPTYNKDSKNMPVAVASTVNITKRANHKAIQMLDGRILLVGGDIFVSVPGVPNVPTMDIYDPLTETFTVSTAHPSYLLRCLGYSNFSLVNLPDGRVWIGGGLEANDLATQGYDIYDPVTDTITRYDVLTPNATFPRIQPNEAAYYIGNDQVIVFMSNGLQGILNLLTQEVNVDTLGGSVYQGTYLISPTIVQDANGDIWSFGGTTDPSVGVINTYSNVYKLNVAFSTWEAKHDLITSRVGPSAVLLPGNKIGIYSGDHIVNSVTTKLTSVEIYDIDTDTFTASLDLTGSRIQAASVYLQTGYTLVSGGLNDINEADDSELVHSTTSNFSGSTGLMTIKRSGHTATQLNNGLVLIAGGNGSTDANTTAEIFDPLTKLYVSYLSGQVVVGNTMQFAAKDGLSVTTEVIWTCNKPGIATIDSTGMLTTLTTGNIEVTATSVIDNTTTAVVRITVISQ